MRDDDDDDVVCIFFIGRWDENPDVDYQNSFIVFKKKKLYNTYERFNFVFFLL